MAVKIRMTRMGRRHRPFFRINAVESRTPRNGRIIEKLGHYDPIEKDPAKQVVLNRERAEYWLSQGAIPSDTVSRLLLRLGIKHKYAEQQAARRQRAKAAAREKGKFFTKAEKIAAEKAAEEKVKAQEKARAEAEKAKAEEKAKTEKPKAEPEPKEEPAGEAPTQAKAEAVEEKTGPEPEQAEAEPQAPEEKAEAKAEPEAKEEQKQKKPVRVKKTEKGDEN